MASQSSWRADNSRSSLQVLTTANRWFDDLPSVLVERLGKQSCIRLRYEDWSRDPNSLEQAWHFLGLGFEPDRIRELFSRRVN